MGSLHSAVFAAGQGGLPVGEKLMVGGWELIFSPPRQEGLLPVLKHALYKG